jgi:hypothetical protein
MEGRTYNTTEKGTEERFGGEVIADLFQTEKNTSNGGTKGDGNTAGSTSTEYLPAFAVIVPVLGKYTASNVTYSGSDMYVWAFFAETKPRCHTEDQA